MKPIRAQQLTAVLPFSPKNASRSGLEVNLIIEHLRYSEVTEIPRAQATVLTSSISYMPCYQHGKLAQKSPLGEWVFGRGGGAVKYDTGSDIRAWPGPVRSFGRIRDRGSMLDKMRLHICRDCRCCSFLTLERVSLNSRPRIHPGWEVVVDPRQGPFVKPETLSMRLRIDVGSTRAG
jgi:hypothetical protein